MKLGGKSPEGQSGPQAKRDSAVPQGGEDTGSARSGRHSSRALLTRKVACSFSTGIALGPIMRRRDEEVKTPGVRDHWDDPGWATMEGGMEGLKELG